MYFRVFSAPRVDWGLCFDIYAVLPSFFFENWYKVLRLWSFFCDWNFLTSRKENCPAFLGAAASGGPSINYENLAVNFSIYAENSQILIVGYAQRRKKAGYYSCILLEYNTLSVL